MCVMNGRAHGAEEFDTLSRRPITTRTRCSDRLAFDILHHEVRPSVRCIATIQDSADIRVIQGCQDLAFSPKSTHKLR